MKFITLFSIGFVALFGYFFNQSNKETTAVKTCVTCTGLTGTEKIVCLANDFKATLSASQITTLQYDFTLANAKKWSNLPVGLATRIGIRLGDLNATQLAAAKALVEAATGAASVEGYQELKELWAADDYLLANGGGSSYGSGQYFIAFLGEPSMSGTWELQTGGHHVAVANIYSNGQLVGATPSFRGVEPFAAFTSGGVSMQPLIQERTALAAMLNGLTSTELAAAKLTSTFGDILLGPNKDWQFPTAKSGIKVGTLTASQKDLVRAAIRTYVDDVDDAGAAAIMAVYESGLDETYISYAGNAALTAKNDYVRIDGPRVWIEYSTQNGIILSPTHPHSVWRDRSSDYGGLGGPVGTAYMNNFDGKFQVFPNPTTGNSTIEIEIDQPALISISVFDSNGRLVRAPKIVQMTAGNHQFPLDLGSFPSGSYRCLLESRTDTGSTFATQTVTKLP